MDNKIELGFKNRSGLAVGEIAPFPQNIVFICVKTGEKLMEISEDGVVYISKEFRAKQSDELVKEFLNCLETIGFKLRRSEDVAPVKYGKWEYDSSYDVCSLCGFVNGFDEEFTYCPGCGAKMTT